MIINYDIQSKIDQGLIASSALKSQKFKFVLYNSNLSIKCVNFTEHSFVDFSSNALFRMNFGEYKTINIEDCYFELEQILGMT